MKEHFPWCSCFGRETKDGRATAQCQRPKMVGGFYSCICKKDEPNLQTGEIDPVQCAPLDPYSLLNATGLQQNTSLAL